MTRFPSNPIIIIIIIIIVIIIVIIIIIRGPFFLIFGFNKEAPDKKGKRVLPGNLVERLSRGLQKCRRPGDHGSRGSGQQLVRPGLGFRV